MSVVVLINSNFFSPRRRSKTPDSSEKFKRNVHFQDEEKHDESNARESSDADERTKQDTREIVHPDGKVMMLYRELSQKQIFLLLPDGMHGISPHIHSSSPLVVCNIISGPMYTPEWGERLGSPTKVANLPGAYLSFHSMKRQ